MDTEVRHREQDIHIGHQLYSHNGPDGNTDRNTDLPTALEESVGDRNDEHVMLLDVNSERNVRSNKVIFK